MAEVYTKYEQLDLQVSVQNHSCDSKIQQP